MTNKELEERLARLRKLIALDRREHTNEIKRAISRSATGLFLYVGIITCLILLANCGPSNSSSPSLPQPPDTPIQCTGCPSSRAGAHVWLYPQNNTLAMSLEIEGTIADNPAMDAWTTYPEVAVYLLQWDDIFEMYVRTSAFFVTGTKPGAYDSTYFVWDSAADDFCLNDTWCSAWGPAYIELYVDDGVNQWSVLGLPAITPPYLN